MSPERGNVKAVANVAYVDTDARTANGHWFDRKQWRSGLEVIARLAVEGEDLISPGALQQRAARLFGTQTSIEAVEQFKDKAALITALAEQAIFCGGNQYSFQVFGGEAIRRRGEMAYFSEPRRRVRRFLEGMESLTILHGYFYETLRGVIENFTRRNTALFEADDTGGEYGQGFYLRLAAAANRHNGAGVSGEPLIATVTGEGWVWPGNLSLMRAQPAFVIVSYNSIGVHQPIGSRYKYTSGYQHRVTTRTTHKERFKEDEKYTVTDVLHCMPDGLPADLTAQNVFLLYHTEGKKRAVFPKGPFFLGATRESLKAVFAHTGYEVVEPTTLEDMADAVGIKVNGTAYPEEVLLREAAFVGACGTTYAVLGIGEIRFRGDGRLALNKDFFPKEQVDLYFRAVVGLETVPGVEVHSFPIER